MGWHFRERVDMVKKFTAIIERKENGYIAVCPELNVTSNGETAVDARKNLQEVLESFYTTASLEEINNRFHNEVYVTQVEIAIR